MTLTIAATYYPVSERKIEILKDKAWQLDVLETIQRMMNEVSHHNHERLFLDLKLSRTHLTFVTIPEEKEELCESLPITASLPICK